VQQWERQVDNEDTYQRISGSVMKADVDFRLRAFRRHCALDSGTGHPVWIATSAMMHLPRRV
jgi:hypothetical protein